MHVAAFFALPDPGGSVDGLDYAAHERFRYAVRSAWADYFRDIDVLVCPVTFGTAFAHDAGPFEQRTIDTADGPRE